VNAQQLLMQYLSAPDSSADTYIEPLAEEIRKLVRRSVSKREVSDIEDFEEDCIVAIWTRIEAMKRGAALDAIDNLEGFVRRAVHNRYCDAIRRKRPSWYNLKLELLDTFSGKLNVEGFAMWPAPSGVERLCGFAEWRGRADWRAGACRELAEDPGKFLRQAIGNRDPAELAVSELAAAILDWVGGPVEIDDLTSCIAALLQVRDAEPLSIDAQPEADEDSTSPVDWLIADDTDVEQQVVGQGWLDQVLGWFWKEFKALSLKQRKAIFLGLSTEQAAAIVASCGIEETALALEMDARFLAQLIARLPLPDADIAAQLEVPPRSVPSVRFKAWRRIQRRARKSGLVEGG